jgi:phage terminase large subunit
MKLLKKQKIAVHFLKDQKTTEVYYGGAAGGGKSALGCLWLIESCQKYPNSRWLLGRAKLDTLKATTLKTFFELSSKLGINSQFIYKENKKQILFNNGSEIILKDLFYYPSDPEFDSLGSLEVTGAFIDECPQIVYKAWQIVKSRIRYKLKEFDLQPKILGTGNPSKGWAYSEFYKPKREGKLRDSRAFIQALPTDNPHLPESYLKSLLELDKNSKERLYYGNWEYDDDPSALINYDSIIDIFSNDHVKPGVKYITADIARLGEDSTVIGVWSGWRLEQIITMKKALVTEVSAKIKEVATKNLIPMSRVVVDADGVGGGVKDILKCKGFVNGSKPLKNGNFTNLRSQCYFHASEKINSAEVYVASEDIEVKERVTEELEQVKQRDIDKDGKRAVIAREKFIEVLGRSPDYATIIMMRSWFDLAPQSQYL